MDAHRFYKEYTHMLPQFHFPFFIKLDYKLCNLRITLDKKCVKMDLKT